MRPGLARTVVVVTTAYVSFGCASAEEELINRYFAANQRGDNETVAALSMVAFPGEVESWNVLSVGEAERRPYAVPALREAVEAAEDARDEQFKVFGEFRQEHYETLREMSARLRENPDATFSGQRAELKVEWDAYREERRDVVASLRDREIELENEIRRVTKSLQRESTPEYLTGEMETKRAQVRVTTPSGDQQVQVELTRYELTNQFDALVPARWIITEVSQAG